MNIHMKVEKSLSSKGRVAIFPSTREVFTLTALVSICVENSLVPFYVHRTIQWGTENSDVYRTVKNESVLRSFSNKTSNFLIKTKKSLI